MTIALDTIATNLTEKIVKVFADQPEGTFLTSSQVTEQLIKNSGLSLSAEDTQRLSSNVSKRMSHMAPTGTSATLFRNPHERVNREYRYRLFVEGTDVNEQSDKSKAHAGLSTVAVGSTASSNPMQALSRSAKRIRAELPEDVVNAISGITEFTQLQHVIQLASTRMVELSIHSSIELDELRGNIQRAANTFASLGVMVAPAASAVPVVASVATVLDAQQPEPTAKPAGDADPVGAAQGDDLVGHAA